MIDVDKLESAIETAKLASRMSQEFYGKPMTVCYSGGKDSDALVGVCLAAGVPFRVIHSLTTADAPETVTHVKKLFASLEEKGIEASLKLPTYKGERTTMWKLIPHKKMPPTRIVRYCCKHLKEASTPNSLAVLGVRADESYARSKRGKFEIKSVGKKRLNWSYEHAAEVFEESRELPEVFDCTMIASMRKRKESMVNPILDWSTSDVVDFCEYAGISLNPLYERGYSRVGCLICPMGGATRQREAAEYPSYKRAYIRAFGKMLETRRSLGMKCDWSTGEEVWHWWIEDGVIPGQLQMELGGD